MQPDTVVPHSRSSKQLDGWRAGKVHAVAVELAEIENGRERDVAADFAFTPSTQLTGNVALNAVVGAGRPQFSFVLLIFSSKKM